MERGRDEEVLVDGEVGAKIQIPDQLVPPGPHVAHRVVHRHLMKVVAPEDGAPRAVLARAQKRLPGQFDALLEDFVPRDGDSEPVQHGRDDVEEGGQGCGDGSVGFWVVG